MNVRFPSPWSWLLASLVPLGCSAAAGGAGEATGSSADAVTGSSIASLALANVGKMACSTNSLGGHAFDSSCTGNGGQPEYWCADFARWVWAAEGAQDTSQLTAAAGSFYVYGQNHGTLHATPSLGDAVVFNYAGNGYADHVAIVTQVNSNGTIETASGDWNGQSGSEAQFASTSHVVLNAPAYPHTVGGSPGIIGMTISGFISPVGLTVPPPPPPPDQPRGSLDHASCTTVDGWTQDPAVPKTSIFADVYFGGAAGAKGATGVRLTADVSRADLCKPLGSCTHAYTMPAPRSLLDGKAHAVYAYGINHASGGLDTLLTGAPKTMTCVAPALATSAVKRHVVSTAILTDYRFDTFLDEAPYDAARLAAVHDGVDLSVAPHLVQFAGNPAVYVVDGAFKRHVASPDVMTAWRFVSTDVKPITASALAALTSGPDWPAAPLLVKDPAAPAVYLLDVALPVPGVDGGVPVGGGAGGTAGAGDDAGAAGVSDDGGAGSMPPDNGATDGAGASSGGGCSTTGGSRVPSFGWLVAMGAAFVGMRRRARSRG